MDIMKNANEKLSVLKGVTGEIVSTKLQVRSGQVRSRLTVSQLVCLGVEPHLGLMTRY
jgi:hypothetical protein